MTASAKIKLLKLTIDGSADRVREVIEEYGLDLTVQKKGGTQGGIGGQTPMVKSPRTPGALIGAAGGLAGGLAGSFSADIGSNGVVGVTVRRTYGVTESWIVSKLFECLQKLQEFENKEEVFSLGGSYPGSQLVAQWCGKIQRQAKKAKKLQEDAQKTVFEAAKMAEQKAKEAAAAVTEASFAARDIKSFAAGEVDKTESQGPGGRLVGMVWGAAAAANSEFAIEIEVEVVDATELKKGQKTMVLVADSEEQHTSWCDLSACGAVEVGI